MYVCNEVEACVNTNQHTTINYKQYKCSYLYICMYVYTSYMNIISIINSNSETD